MRKLLLCLVCLVVTQVATADDGARDRLIGLLEKSDNMTAAFEQKTFKEASAHADVSSGTLEITKPMKFNWVVTKPYEQRVVSDGETLWVFDPDLEQATYKPISEDIHQSPAMILVQPSEALTGKYDVMESTSGNLISYKLYPLLDDQLFSELNLVFSDELISEIRILDSLGQETVIEFSNVKVGQTISNEHYEFTPPPGTDLFESM